MKLMGTKTIHYNKNEKYKNDPFLKKFGIVFVLLKSKASKRSNPYVYCLLDKFNNPIIRLRIKKSSLIVLPVNCR